MDSSRQILLVFTICLSFFLHSLSPASADDATPSKLIEKVCSSDQYPKSEYSFCVQVLGSNAKAKAATNLVDLAKIIVQIAGTNATSTQNYIQKLINSSQSPKKETFKDCLVAYNGVVVEFFGAVKEMDSKDYDMAYYACGIAVDEGQRCEDILAAAKITDSSITAANKLVKKFAHMCFAATDLLQ